MHRFTLRTNLFVWVGVSGVSDGKDNLQSPPAEVPRVGAVLPAQPPRMHSQIFFLFSGH